MSVLEELTLEINQSIEINADIGDAWRALVRRLTSENSTPDNRAMPMVLEEWPGGRWFRDLGQGQGHLWGHVQVIKPPSLIEMHGGTLEILSKVDAGTEVTIRMPAERTVKRPDDGGKLRLVSSRQWPFRVV